MTLSNFTLTREPCGDLYLQLIDYLFLKSELALLVVRDSKGLSEEASGLLQKLEPYLHRREQADRWPGTVLMRDKAQVLYYNLTPELAHLLKSASSLYRWQHPSLPEDLCFLRQTGEPLFTSIAHEHDAYFSLSDEEFQVLLTEAPEIALIVQRDEAGPAG